MSKTTKKTSPKSPRKETVKDKIVFFKFEDLEKMKRKRLQSLTKRIGGAANKSNDELREKLTDYYEKNKSKILKLGLENEKKKAEKATLEKKPKKDEKDKLKSTVHYKDKIVSSKSAYA
eukprot:TRINITY_DN6350_c0_g1_i1.p1 TRINITY_DN6350_c0_g1~~TRINITY_DN6350_c0_g1_i1.p1  ORF type:complete len:119 (+),score=26.56 TRINITY_DN6350_c0_g1_i1:126-482(+)